MIHCSDNLMDNPAGPTTVQYRRDGDSETVHSNTKLFGKSSSSKMNTRLLYTAIVILVCVVIALAIAVALVASDNNNNNNKDNKNSGQEGTSGTNPSGQTQDDNSYWPVPDCSHTTSNVDKANCVLDSYPLVDG